MDISAATTSTGFYRRALPSPPAIDFSSMEGKKLLIESIQNGTAEGFYKLISNFQTQSEPAYCGLASLSMVLNALAIDPGRTWKGPWRWFDESMLDCCESLENVKAEGISIGKLACVGHCAGAKVEAFRTNQTTIEAFRQSVSRCSSWDDRHLISSYHRGALDQTGRGHFSPIGAYHAAKDMALILDVARFKYPPHWLPLTLLWEAMQHIDEATGLPRGFMLISRPHSHSGLLYNSLTCKNESWVCLAKYLLEDVPFLLKSEGLRVIHQLMSAIFASLPPNFGGLIPSITEYRKEDDGDENLSPEEKSNLALKADVLKQIHGTQLYKHVANLCSNKSSENDFRKISMTICCHGDGEIEGILSFSEQYYDNKCSEVEMLCQIKCTLTKTREIKIQNSARNEVLTALLLALPGETWAGIRDDSLANQIHKLVSTEDLPNLLQEEVLHLRRRIYLMKRCRDNRVEEELGLPFP